MGHVEQIPTPVLSMDEANQKKQEPIKESKDKIVDGSAPNVEKIDWEDVAELSEEKAKKLSNEVMQNAANELSVVLELTKQFEDWKLKGQKKEKYENLMANIRAELDKEIPRVVDMGQIIDSYVENPQKSNEYANRIVSNESSREQIKETNKVITGMKYLPKAHQEKLYATINSETSKLDEDTKMILEMNQNNLA